MQAAILTAFGPPDVLQLQEVEKPKPGDNEIRVDIKATSVNYGDLAARNFKAITPRKFNMPLLFWFFAKLYFGFARPRIKILGSEFAGIVESVGRAVKSFKPGDPVFGYLGQGMGAYAEYVCVPETGVLATKPANVTFEEAAVAPYGAIMAWYLLRKAGVRDGQRVLVNGASGSIGSAAVQIAKYFGAQVTGVCGAPRMEFVRSLGAEHVIDYKATDFTQSGETYDLIFDILGKSSFSRCKKSLTARGCYLRASFKTKQLLQMLWTALTGGKRVLCVLAPGSVEDLRSVKDLLATGQLKSIIDKCYPLGQAAGAHRHVENGNHKGKVAITI